MWSSAGAAAVAAAKPSFRVVRTDLVRDTNGGLGRRIGRQGWEDGPAPTTMTSGARPWSMLSVPVVQPK